MSSALHVSLDRYRLHSGRLGFAATRAPLLPSSVAGGVVGISGLSNLQRNQPLLHAAKGAPRVGGGSSLSPATAGVGSASSGRAAGPTACTAAKAAATKFDLHPWTQLATAYGFTAAYAKGDLGTGSTIGISRLEPPAAPISPLSRAARPPRW